MPIAVALEFDMEVIEMTTLKAIQARAEYFGIKTKPWFKGEKFRLYAVTDRKDMKVYLDLDGSTKDCILGAAFKVFCATPQHPNWIKSQVNQYREEFAPLWHAFVIAAYGAGDDLSGYGEDIREMVAKSRAFLDAFESDEPDAEIDEDRNDAEAPASDDSDA